jgi:hypothetical protein
MIITLCVDLNAKQRVEEHEVSKTQLPGHHQLLIVIPQMKLPGDPGRIS